MAHKLFAVLLTLWVSLPRLAGAVGLGEIHVASALNEPLSAEIDIVGATDEELVGLTAAVASHETFERYNAERPAFLASIRFRIAHNAAGMPILDVHSADPFTDPVVRLLIDLRWGRGQVIKDYSVLLDPAGATQSAPITAAR